MRSTYSRRRDFEAVSSQTKWCFHQPKRMLYTLSPVPSSCENDNHMTSNLGIRHETRDPAQQHVGSQVSLHLAALLNCGYWIRLTLAASWVVSRTVAFPRPRAVPSLSEFPACYAREQRHSAEERPYPRGRYGGHALRQEGLDLDDPGMITVINLVCCESALLNDGPVTGVAKRDVGEATQGGGLAEGCRRF